MKKGTGLNCLRTVWDSVNKLIKIRILYNRGAPTNGANTDLKEGNPDHEILAYNAREITKEKFEFRGKNYVRFPLRMVAVFQCGQVKYIYPKTQP